MKKIFVNRAAVEVNHQNGSSEPVFMVRDADGTEHRTSSIIILGPSEIRYDPNGPEGSRIWIETHDKLMLKNPSDDPDRPTLLAV